MCKAKPNRPILLIHNLKIEDSTLPAANCKSKKLAAQRLADTSLCNMGNLLSRPPLTRAVWLSVQSDASSSCERPAVFPTTLHRCYGAMVLGRGLPAGASGMKSAEEEDH